MASPVRIALIGFGAVGRGFLSVLRRQSAALAADYGLTTQIVGVSTLRHGSLYCPTGLGVEILLSTELVQYPDQPMLQRNLTSLELIVQPAVDVVVEVSYTDLTTGEPATSHVRTALEAGKHVITANKGPVALAFAELKALARQKGVLFGYEGTVMGGTPTIRLAEWGLAGSGIHALRGILNGTTNYILSRMEDGDTYELALAEAQRLGYAEADPTGDVEGYDAAGKLIILSNVVFGKPLRMENIALQGITRLTGDAVSGAMQTNNRWRLIAELIRAPDESIAASVQPARLPITDPLALVRGATNAISFSTDSLGDVTLIGPGAGGEATGFAILSDLLALHRIRMR